MTKTATQIAHEAGKFPYGTYHPTCAHCNPKAKVR